MAFKAITEYNEERFGNLFKLDNDGDYADVIFMYQSLKDVLVADVHYVKSADYSGYVHCCGRGCPACAKGIRVQSKLFIPLYDINTNQLIFWDRNVRFQRQLDNDVLSKFPNPSEYVFRITRKGLANDINTSYSIVAVGKNTVKSYSDILKDLGISLPDHYLVICREYDALTLKTLLTTTNTESSAIGTLPDYQVTPRKINPTLETVTPVVSIPQASEPVAASWPDTPPWETESTEVDTEGIDDVVF